MFLILMRVLLDRGQKVGIVANLRALGVLPLTEAAVRQLNLRFTPAQRTSLITLLAKAGATDDAFLLFQHWTQCRYEEGLDFDSARSVAAKFRGPDSIQVGDALMERQIRLCLASARDASRVRGAKGLYRRTAAKGAVRHRCICAIMHIGGLDALSAHGAGSSMLPRQGRAWRLLCARPDQFSSTAARQARHYGPAWSVHLALEAINSVKTSFARPNAKTAVSSPTARQRDPEKHRLQWIGILDELVHRLRWATFFDTGNDYRHSLPLWKSSKARDGQLIPAELDDMMTLGFEGRGRKRQAAGGRGASAPRLTGARDEAQHGNDASSSEDGDVSKDAALPQPRASSPNVLPAILYRRLMEAYLALADAAGAAEVAAWMRDEAGMEIAESQRAATTFVSRIKAAVRDRESDTAHESDTSNILRMLAGQQGTATTKRWWTP
ncbi:hypothetical protein L1887_48586 [Cichorium endivia]|nr:hypothetical protein L1887_48586 [Cichorium endivia]